MKEYEKITRLEPCNCTCGANEFSFYSLTGGVEMLIAACKKCGLAYGMIKRQDDAEAKEAAREEYEKATGANVQFTPEEKEGA